MEKQKQLDFFEENDAKVCKKLTKVLRWMTLVFPVLFLATAAGVFQIKYDDLAVLSVLGCVCTLGPGILQKLGVPKEVQSVNWILYYLAQGCLSASLSEKNLCSAS